jgi:hypothetical protein
MFLQNTPQWPSGWAVIGWIAAGIIAAIYLFSGVLQNLSSGRKELLEVKEKKLSDIIKEKDEAEFLNKELQKQLEKLEKEKSEIEKDKTMLMREHHQLLEISVADLHTLTNNAKLISQLEDEVNRYREEKGLSPRPKSVNTSRTDG